MEGTERRIIWSLPAERDLVEVWNYLYREASRDIADAQARKIRDRCALLRAHPLMGRPRDKLQPGLRAVLVSPYIVFHRVMDNDVQIVRVLHERRNIEAIFAADRG
jgi:toxin ParE1/3/4